MALIGLETINNEETSSDYEPKLHDIGFYPVGKGLLNSTAYMRTILFNPHGDLVTGFFDPKFGMWQTSHMKVHDFEQDLTKDEFFRVRRAQDCPNRCFFVTKQGSSGAGPKETWAGDQVCVLFGTIAPFVIRPVDRQFVLLWRILSSRILERRRDGGNGRRKARIKEIPFPIVLVAVEISDG
jgi:hypothetical protein